MSKKTDQIKEEISQTKADLTEKLGELEAHLREDAAAVKDGVEGVIHQFQGTARLFSLKHQVRQRPLLMVGGSVLSGLIITRWWISSGDSRPVYAAPDSSGPSLLGRVARRYPDEVGVIKSLAFNLLLSLVAEKARAGMPDLVDKIGEIETQIKSSLDARKSSPKPETP